MRDWNAIIPELKDWKPPQSPEGLAACLGTYNLAIGYSTLFWPSFVEYDGMVFRGEEMDKDAISSWMKTTSGNKQSVESILNHLHVIDIQHSGIWKDATEAQVKYIGQTLRDAWACKLARDFPQKLFTVEFIEGSSENLREYQVTFFQEPRGAGGDA